MKTLKALRDSRKYFITFVTLALVTFFYVRLDVAATDYRDRMDNFKAWGWVVMAITGGYLGANALQNSMSNGPEVTQIDETLRK